MNRSHAVVKTKVEGDITYGFDQNGNVATTTTSGSATHWMTGIDDEGKEFSYPVGGPGVFGIQPNPVRVNR